jgi:hypothetical protein
MISLKDFINRFDYKYYINNYNLKHNNFVNNAYLNSIPFNNLCKYKIYNNLINKYVRACGADNKEYLKKIAELTTVKSYNHIREILTYVDKLKLGETKKYNLRNYHEYNIIKNILCKYNNYSFTLFDNELIMKDKLIHIEGSRGDNVDGYICCDEKSMTFGKKQKLEPVIYIKVTRKSKKTLYKEIYPYLKNYLPDEIIMYITFYLI